MSIRPLGRYLLAGAAVAGLIHAGFSLYWALGGRWLLPTVGQWAVNLAREEPGAASLLLVLVAAVKSTVALAPLWAYSRPLRRPAVWSGLAWLATVVLIGYGGLNSVVAWLVLGGAIRPDGGYDRQSMIGHAALWDPLFLVWGLLLGAGLLATARDRRKRAAIHR